MPEALVCSTSDVDFGSVAGFEIVDDSGKKHAIAVIHSAKDKWFAVIDRCSHGRFKLSEGEVEDDGIECTRHGSVFSLEDGRPMNPPASEPIKIYGVRVDGDNVYVDIT